MPYIPVLLPKDKILIRFLNIILMMTVLICGTETIKVMGIHFVSPSIVFELWKESKKESE